MINIQFICIYCALVYFFCVVDQFCFRSNKILKLTVVVFQWTLISFCINLRRTLKIKRIVKTVMSYIFIKSALHIKRDYMIIFTSFEIVSGGGCGCEL